MSETLTWPYPMRYGQETWAKADVLVLGGGLAGCYAAISAARKGQSVILVDKSCTAHSGAAGVGDGPGPHRERAHVRFRRPTPPDSDCIILHFAPPVRGAGAPRVCTYRPWRRSVISA